jgi:hypothetical protein
VEEHLRQVDPTGGCREYGRSAPRQIISKTQNKLRIQNPSWEKYIGSEDKFGKIRGVGNPMWNNFHYCNLFQISTDFEIFKRFRVKASLTEMCSYRLIATLLVNPLELHFGGVLHGDTQCLYYHLADMHTQYPKIEEDIEFSKVLNIKQFPGKTRKLII